jgi:hypothetical protein
MDFNLIGNPRPAPTNIPNQRAPDKHKEIKEKILNIIRTRGPSLPVNIASGVNISLLFANVFLSELVDDKLIKSSSMKVGSSSLFYVEGQESQLERFYTFLKDKDKETFLMVKSAGVLRESALHPANRVSIKTLRDFAIPMNINGEIFWKFFTFPEEQAIGIIKKIISERPRIEPQKEIPKLPVREEKIEIKQEILKPHLPKVQIKETIIESLPVQEIRKQKPKEHKKQLEPIFGEQTVQKVLKEKPEKPKKIREKTKFINEALESLKEENIEFLEEIEYKKKDYIAIIKVNSALGNIDFMAVIKDKKKLTEDDLTLIHQKAQALKLPALVITKGELNKDAKEYAKTWANFLKIKKF